MHTHRLSHGRWSPRCLFGLLVLAPLALLTGCQNDDITTYHAPRAETSTSNYGRKRLIAVIFPQDETMWVVKLIGPEKQVEPLVADFDKIVESVELTKDDAKPITWTVPPGWSELPGNKDRFTIAALKSPGDEPLEVTISVPLKHSSLLENVIRWRGQVGLTSRITEEQVEQITKQAMINGVNTRRVDLVGTTMTAAKPAPHPMVGLPNAADKPIQYKTPADWKEMPNGQFSLAKFAVQSGNEQAVVSISPLRGQERLLLANVNRWRGEVDLEGIGENQLKKDLKDEKVGGIEAQYLKLEGDQKSTLVFLVQRGDETWFFKMMGSKNLVEKQEAVFKEFCHSVEFK